MSRRLVAVLELHTIKSHRELIVSLKLAHDFLFLSSILWIIL